MEDHLRFAICYWHSFCWQGNDPFGGPSFERPWFADADPMQMAKLKADVAFELFRLTRVPFFTFHDRDVAPEGATFAESNRNFRTIIELFAKKMEETKVKLLWGHGEPVLPSALHVRCRHQPEPRSLRLGSGPGKERARGDP